MGKVANLCSTTIWLYGDAEKITRVEEKIASMKSFKDDVLAEKYPCLKNEKWLGNLALSYGLYVDELVYRDGKVEVLPEAMYSASEINLRGLITFVEKNSETELILDTETDWEPSDALFTYIAEEEGIKLAWFAEEPGLETFLFHDPDRKFFGEELFVINKKNEFNEINSFRCDSESELLEELRKEGVNAHSIPEAEEIIKNKKLLNIWFNQFEEV